MPIKRLNIADWKALGLLIKTWASRTDRLNIAGQTFLPAPTTIKGFMDMLVASGAATRASVDDWLASFDGRLTQFSIVQSTPEHLVVRLPMLEMMEATEKSILNAQQHDLVFDYPLPDFYSSHIFSGAAKKITKAMDVHAERIGDYTIAQCG